MDKKIIYKENEGRNLLLAGVVGLSIVGGVLGLAKISNNTLDKKYKSDQRQKYNQKIDSTYNSIVKENVDDTTFVRLLKDYIPFSEKEKVVKQNSLENKTQE